MRYTEKDNKITMEFGTDKIGVMFHKAVKNILDEFISVHKDYLKEISRELDKVPKDTELKPVEAFVPEPPELDISDMPPLITEHQDTIQ